MIGMVTTLGVLAKRDDLEVRALAVERIPIEMIDDHAIRGTRDDAV